MAGVREGSKQRVRSESSMWGQEDFGFYYR